MPLPDRANFHASAAYEMLVRSLGLDAAGVFTDPRIVAWRKLDDRQNCTLDVSPTSDELGTIRLHVKRYHAARVPPAEAEVAGHRLLAEAGIPTAPLVAWGKLPDGRSFTIWADLAGHAPTDKLIEGGRSFASLLNPTADLAARLHGAGLHHRDLYLCHFMAGGATASPDVKLIDVARVARVGSILTRRRWFVKDLAQFWYSTMQLGLPDNDRSAWLARYAATRGLADGGQGLRGAIERKVRSIARHDRRLRLRQPTRNISIPT